MIWEHVRVSFDATKNTPIASQYHRVIALFCRGVEVVQQIMLQGKEGGRGSGGDANLIVDMLNVVSDGLLSDAEALGHLAICKPARHQPQDLHLTPAQAGGQLSTWHAPSESSSSQNSMHRVSVESASMRFHPEMHCGCFRCLSRAVGPPLGESMVDIGGREYLCG